MKISLFLFAATGALATQLINFDDIPQRVKNIEYAVRGKVVDRAMELEAELKNPNNTLPFDEIVYCNIGNPQGVGLNPLTFHRQVLSLLSNPALLDDPETLSALKYGEDVIARAKKYLAVTKFGAYSHSKGLAPLREEVARSITRRDNTTGCKGDLCDGCPITNKPVVNASADDIFMTDGTETIKIPSI